MDLSRFKDGYTYQHYRISARMMVAIRAYCERGVPVEQGDFLESLICHEDVFKVVGLADDENKANIPAFTAFFHNEVASGCHGSRENYEAWIAKFERPEKPEEE
jgi:hypothetical protein